MRGYARGGSQAVQFPGALLPGVERFPGGVRADAAPVRPGSYLALPVDPAWLWAAQRRRLPVGAGFVLGRRTGYGQ